jgi:uncharacterized protein (DUF1684 family)
VIDPEAHRAEVEAWRDGRYAALKRDLGWLTLAGLVWLETGRNRVGSHPDAGVVIPGAPADVGWIDVAEDGSASATGAWSHQGILVDGVPLTDDADGAATILEIGDLRQCVIRRGGRLGLRTWNLASPARSTFAGIPHWPVDPAWRLDARFHPTPERSITVPDVLGIEESQASPGEVEFAALGSTHRLQALSGGPGGDLWLVFGDVTNGTDTYAGGRFLYTAAPDAERRVVVDFNRAYNPPCVFSGYATCPLPWPENRLPMRIEAGEQRYSPST